MSTELEDAKEFLESANKFVKDDVGATPTEAPTKAKRPTKSEEGKSLNPGVPTQYALYSEGYTATTPTIETLPADCYDIFSDSKCVYAVPALRQSGLLLELPEMRS